MDNQVGFMDYAFFIGTLLVSALIGVYYRFTGGKQRTTEEYLLANRSLKVLPVAFSLTTNFMSAITLLGVSSENYLFGTHFVVINFGYLVFTPVVAYLILPKFFKLGSFSAYGYLKLRFGPVARTVTSLCFLVQSTLYMGIALYAPALVIKSIMELSESLSIWIVGLVGLFYSILGGMKAVIVADVFQSILMYLSLFGIILVEALNRGGLMEIWWTAKERGRVDFSNFSLDPTERHTWFSLIIGGGLTYLSLYGVNQTQIQRCISMKSLRNAQKALWVQWGLLVLLSLTTSFCGLAIFSRYRDCDPIKSGRIQKGDELMPLFVKDSLSQLSGFGGLFLAGVMSACLTTVSASLNSLSTVTLEDYAKPLYKMATKRSISSTTSVHLSKLFTLFYGLLCISLAFVTRHLGGILQLSLSIFGAMGGPVIGIFTLAMFVPFSNEFGAVTGILCGLVASFTLALGGPKPPPTTLPVSMELCPNSTIALEPPQNAFKDFPYVYRISYLWYILIGLLVTIFVGILASSIRRLFGNGNRGKVEISSISLTESESHERKSDMSHVFNSL